VAEVLADPSVGAQRVDAARFGAILRPVAIFGTFAVALGAVVWLASDGCFGRFSPGRVETYFVGPDFLAGWMHWDGEWYRKIAVTGYFFSTERQSSVAFFPAYPLSMRALGWVAGDPATWGVVVTALSGCAVAALFPAWCRRVGLGSSALTGLVVLLAWPYSWYLFGAVYADALFIAAALAAFVLLESDRPVAAGIAGALATAARPVGMAVVIGLLIRTVERRGGWRALRRRDAGVLVSLTGLAAYAAYLLHRFDEPFAFAKAEGAPGWEQDPGPRVWFKEVFWHRLAHLPDSGTQYFASIAFQAVLVIALLALVPLVVRRVGWGYGLYSLAVLGMPLLSSKDFMGLGRYALAAFPVFAVLGAELHRRPRLLKAWVPISAIVLVFLTAAYSRGAYLA
jgi:hypothetical protein